MATTLFLRNLGVSGSRVLSTRRGAASTTKVTNTTNGPTAGVQVTETAGGTATSWLSPCLKAVTIAGNISVNIRGLESASQANTGLDVLVERCDSAGNVISQIGRAEDGAELGTSDAAMTWTITPSSTALSDGDRIKVTVFGNDAGGNMGNGRTFTISIDGPTSGAAGDSFLTFTENLVFIIAPSAIDSSESFGTPTLVVSGGGGGSPQTIDLNEHVGGGAGLAVVQTNSGVATTGDPSTGSWTPTAGNLLVVGVLTRATGITASVAGNGQTWIPAPHGDKAGDRGQDRLQVFYCIAASPSAGAITATLAGNTNPSEIIAIEISGADATTPIEADAIIGTGGTDNNTLSGSVTTLTNNAWILGILQQRNRTITLDGSLTSDLEDVDSGGAAGSNVIGTIAHKVVSPPGSATVSGGLSNTSDWVAWTGSIKPAGGASSPAGGIASAESVSGPSVGVGFDTFTPQAVQQSFVKPNRPIWYAHGNWWAILYDSATWRICRRNANGDWTLGADTNLGTSSSRRYDAWYDEANDKLYISGTSDGSSKFHVYTYSAGDWSQSASVDGDWHATFNTDERHGRLVLDSAGKMWVFVLTEGGLITYTVLDPTVPSISTAKTTLVSGLGSVDPDFDILDVIAFNDGTPSIGVAYSKISAQSTFFLHHHDSDAVGTWQTVETVDATANHSDNHVSLAKDPSGNLYVANKTTLTGNGDDNIWISKRTAGSWSAITVVLTRYGGSTAEYTRPRIIIDAAGDLHLLVTRDITEGVIHHILYPQGNLGAGQDSIIISRAGVDIDNPAVTLQPIPTATSGILVLACVDSGLSSVFEALLSVNSTATILPTAIGSGEAFGTPTLRPGSVVIQPSAIASGETFGTVVLKATAKILPSAIASGESLGNPTLLHGGVIIQPTTIASGEAVGTPILKATASILPQGVASGEALGTPTVLPGSVRILPGAIASAEAVGVPTLVATAKILPSAIDSGEQLGTPVLVGQSLGSTILPSAIDSVEAVGNPTLRPGGVLIQPGAIGSSEAVSNPTLVATAKIFPSAFSSQEAVGQPALLPGGVTIRPAAIGSTESVSQPTLRAGSVLIAPAAIASEEGLGTPALVAGGVAIQPSAIGSQEAVGTPQLIPVAKIQPTAVNSQEAFGTPTVIPGSIRIVVSGIASGESVGSPVLSQAGGPSIIRPAAIDSAEAVGTPSLLPGRVVIAPTGITSGESFGSQRLLAGQIGISPTSIGSAEVLGTPDVRPGNVNIRPSGVASTESLGLPTVIPVSSVRPTAISSAELFGLPILIPRTTIVVEGIAPAESLGFPNLSSDQTIFPVSIDSAEVVGQPIISGARIRWRWARQSGFIGTHKQGWPHSQSGQASTRQGGWPSSQKAIVGTTKDEGDTG